MKLPSFHIPQGAKEWLMALLWASISGGINSVIEYYATGIEFDFFTESGRQILFSRFAFGFVGGLVMYLKVFVRGASKLPEDEKAKPQQPDGQDPQTKKE
jgi:hypothetical protein